MPRQSIFDALLEAIDLARLPGPHGSKTLRDLVEDANAEGLITADWQDARVLLAKAIIEALEL